MLPLLFSFFPTPLGPLSFLHSSYPMLGNTGTCHSEGGDGEWVECEVLLLKETARLIRVAEQSTDMTTREPLIDGAG